MRRLLPTTLFGRTLGILVLSFGIFAVLNFAAVVYYALAPVSKRSAEDLAAFVVLSAQTWAMLPPNLRQFYVDKLYAEHHLWITQEQADLPNDEYFLPYVYRVEQALESRLGFPLPLRSQKIDGRRWFWIEMTVGQNKEPVRVGFPRDRIETRPATGLAVLLTLFLILVLLTSAALARQITRPLVRLSEAADRVGRGQLPDALPERGPGELAALAERFNEMARQVKDLLANRTTLLAGISHDLRTPIARMRLALEMLPDGCEGPLVQRMQADLEQIDRLIGQSLTLVRDLEAGKREDVDAAELIDGLVLELSDEVRPILWQPPGACPCRVNTTALRRVLANLIENALRYGGDEPVEVTLDCSGPRPEIQVLDRGPGIPDGEKEAVFRPFYRLETSRSVDTGGSGLGLAIACQLADANGCRIEMRDRIGGGTAACVLLPICGEA